MDDWRRSLLASISCVRPAKPTGADAFAERTRVNVQETTLQEALLIDLSRRIAAQIQAQPFQRATNAWRAFIHFPELFQSGGRLVEGWYVIEEAHRVTINEQYRKTLANASISRSCPYR